MGVTAFAPTDSAFASLDTALREQLASGQLDNGARYQLLAAHFSRGGIRWPSSKTDPPRSSKARSTSRWTRQPSAATQSRMPTSPPNGIIHVIDGVVVPSAVSPSSRASS